MKTQNMVEIRNLTKRFGTETTLDDVSFGVSKGEFFGLLGLDGSGKSTLLAILARRQRPTAGSALIAGHDVATEPEAVRSLVATVPGEPELDDELSVADVLAIRCGALDVYDCAGRTAATLDLLGIGDLAERTLSTLDTRQVARVDLARALVTEPAVVLVDEEAEAKYLDTGARLAFRKDLAAASRHLKTTVILATSDQAEIGIFSHVAILSDGKLAAYGTPADLTALYADPRLVIRTTTPARLAAYLRTRDIPCSVEDDRVVAKVRNPDLRIDILDSFRNSILDFEANIESFTDVCAALDD